MRANGLPDFPDPGPGGTFEAPLDRSAGGRPAQERAHSACERHLRDGGAPEVDGEAMRRTLALARCLRSEGIEVPDPVALDDGDVAIQLPESHDPDNPDSRFERAQRACSQREERR